METPRAPGAVYPPNRAAAASTPITATGRIAAGSGSTPRVFFSSTIASRAAASARLSWRGGGDSVSTYGCSNNPRRNFTASTRATALSITESAPRPAPQRVEVGDVLLVRRLEHDVETGLPGVLRRHRCRGLGEGEDRRAAGGRRVRKQ